MRNAISPQVRSIDGLQVRYAEIALDWIHGDYRLAGTRARGADANSGNSREPSR